MAKQKLPVTLLIMLAYALLIANAETKLANANAVLTKAKQGLTAAYEENTKLKTQIGEMAKMFEDVRTELQTAKRSGDKLQTAGMKVAELEAKVSVLTKDRNASAAKTEEAEAMVVELLDQLKEQTEKTANLKEHNRKLQVTIDRLKEAGGWD